MLSAEEERQQPQLNEKVSESLTKNLPALQTAKNFAGMLELVDGLIKSVPPTSYDAAYLLDMKAKIYLQLDQLSKAVEPWEQALKLSQQFKYFAPKDDLDRMKFISQLLMGEASNVKDKNAQRDYVSRASEYLKQYLDQTSKPEPEMQMLYANILYFKAQEDPQNVNQALLIQARKVIERGMDTAIRPKEGFYLLLLAILQQQNDYVHSAEWMELLLKQYPNKKDIWPTLFATYYNLANTSKAESKQQREYYIRAINTLERAQTFGFMNTPRDNYNLFTLYVAAGEAGTATDVLYNGMKTGKIESTPTNWRSLGQFLQIANRDTQAIAALREAAKLFPQDGSLNMLIGQIFMQKEKTQEARDEFVIAVKKGNTGDKPHQAFLFLAYAAFELGDFDGALTAINESAKTADGAKDPQVKSLKAGIEAAIEDRDANKKAAAEAAAKKF